MTIENQFYPESFSQVLQNVLRAHPTLHLSIDEERALVGAVVGRIGSQFFFYQGTIESQGDRERIENYVVIASPFQSHRQPSKEVVKLGWEKPGPQNYALLATARQKSFDIHDMRVPTDMSKIDFGKNALWCGNGKHSTRYLQFPRVHIPEATALEEGRIRIETLIRPNRKNRKIVRQSISRAQTAKLIVRSLKEAFGDAPTQHADWQKVFASLNDITSALLDDFNTTFQKGWDNFLDNLDRRAIEFMYAHEEFSTAPKYGKTAYDRLQEAPSEEARSFRETAISLFKRLGVTAFTLPTYDYHDDPKYDYVSASRITPHSPMWVENENILPFWNKIDAGVPPLVALDMVLPRASDFLKKALKSKAPVPPSIIRTIADDEDFELSVSAVYRKLLDLSSPQTIEEWKIIESLVDAYNINEPEDPDLGHIIRTWRDAHDMRSWQRFYDELYEKHTLRNALQAGEEDKRQKPLPHNEIIRQTNALEGMYESIYQNIVAPYALRGDPKFHLSAIGALFNEFLDCLKQNMNLRHLLQGSSYWHSDLVNFGGRLAAFGIVAEDRWLPLVENIETPQGVHTVALTSKSDLQEEADAMKHCVWSYTKHCVERSHILSLRDKYGARLSTLHFVEEVKDGKTRVAIKENNGIRNMKAPQSAVDAAKWLEKEINSGRLKPNFDAIESHRAPLRAKLAELILGFDYRDPLLCEKVFQLFIPCLPTKLRASSKSSTEFLRAIGMDKIMAKHGIPLETPQKEDGKPQREDIVQLMRRLNLSRE